MLLASGAPDVLNLGLDVFFMFFFLSARLCDALISLQHKKSDKRPE